PLEGAFLSKDLFFFLFQKILRKNSFFLVTYSRSLCSCCLIDLLFVWVHSQTHYVFLYSGRFEFLGGVAKCVVITLAN
uniref:Uncharacterized protein n=1 Tax=Oryza brachyantha TaxID=4533 RepID=J3NC46_ORYBR